MRCAKILPFIFVLLCVPYVVYGIAGLQGRHLYEPMLQAIEQCSADNVAEVVKLVATSLRELVRDNDKQQLLIGKELARKCVESCPEGVKLTGTCWHNLGYILFQLHEGERGDLSEAYEAFEKAVALQPELKEGYGMLLNMHGNFLETMRVFGEPQKLSPVSKFIYATAVCGQSVQNCSKSLEMLHEIEEYNLAPRTLTSLYFEIASQAEKVGNFSKAWAYAVKANRHKLANELQTRSTRSAWHRDVMFYQYLDAAVEAYSSDFFLEIQRALWDVKKPSKMKFTPVFIVGLPRSGSSLLEQIVGVHDSIIAAGEMMHFDKDVALSSTCSSELCYMNLSALQDFQVIKNKRIDYERSVLASVAAQAQDVDFTQTRYIIDKLPMNWRHIPLLQLVFPEAKIIYCTRSRIDVGLSNYLTDYKIPYNQWAHDLETITYRIDRHEEIMAVWKEAGSHWLEVSYESLVLQPHDTISRVFDYIGAQSYDVTDCLSGFHKSKRHVYTASQHQVRSELYSGSLQKWRNYETFIKRSVLAKYLVGYAHHWHDFGGS